MPEWQEFESASNPNPSPNILEKDLLSLWHLSQLNHQWSTFIKKYPNYRLSMFAQCFSKYRQIFPNKSIHNIGCPCLRIVFPNIDRYFPIKVVQQQWFSGNQSTSSVSNMLSPFVSRLSFSLINFGQKNTDIFCFLYLFFQNRSYVLYVLSNVLSNAGVCIIH